MSAAQIFRHLRPATVRGAADRREPLTPRTLHKKMTVRVSHGWYFERGEKGFSRGVFPTLGRTREAAPPT